MDVYGSHILTSKMALSKMVSHELVVEPGKHGSPKTHAANVKCAPTF